MSTLSPASFGSTNAGSQLSNYLPPLKQDSSHRLRGREVGRKSTLLAAHNFEMRQPDIKFSSSEPSFSSALTNLYDIGELASRRIAQRLHDESAQLLAVVYLELAEIARERPVDLPRRIEVVKSHLDEVKEQFRQLAYELRPLILDRRGLVPALHELAKGTGTRCGLEVIINEGDLERLDPEIETALYRSVQEALANVSKHAKASHVEVRLWKERNSVICTVSDDGIGFPQNGGETAVCAGIGLIGIQERARTMGGTCVVLSPPGGGSTIKVEIPV